MRRIGLVVVLAISFILTPLVAGAQQAGKVYRVAYLGIGSGGASEPTIELLLSERGWVRGRISSSRTTGRREVRSAPRPRG